MARFKKGQEIVYARLIGRNLEYLNFPKIGEIVVVDGYVPNESLCAGAPPNMEFLQIVEYLNTKDGYRQAFPEDSFEPVMSISELIECINSQPAEV